MKIEEHIQEIAKMIDSGEVIPADVNTHLNEVLKKHNDLKASEGNLKEEFEKSQELLAKTQQANLEMLMEKTKHVDETNPLGEVVDEEKSKEEIENELEETLLEIGEL